MIKVKRDILSYFPKKHVPRPVQAELLQQIEAHWDSSDVIAINAPVALGKSDIAYAIARWAGRASILTPSKILVNQYLSDFTGLPSLKSKEDYACTNDADHNCYMASRIRGTTKKPVYCPRCSYTTALRQCRAVPYYVCNYHVYMAHRLYRPTLIVDEAHNLVPMIQDLAARRVWQHKAGYPTWVQSYSDLVRWLEPNEDPALADIRDLVMGEPKFIMQRTRESYGREHHLEDVIKLIPLDVRDHPPVLWPKGTVEKIVLLSATIGRRDIDALGLGKDRGFRVTYIEAASPIPVANRPVVFDPVVNASFAGQSESIPVLAAHIKRLRDYHFPGNGVVHCTYDMARKLEPFFLDMPWALWHDSSSRSEVYNTFLSAAPDSGTVMFASGMYEGIDLKGGLSEWQALCKIPWPSLADPAIAHMAEVDEDLYGWETLKQVLQFSGRVCRTPTDYGVSYILDSTYTRLTQLADRHIPAWYREAME